MLTTFKLINHRTNQQSCQEINFFSSCQQFSSIILDSRNKHINEIQVFFTEYQEFYCKFFYSLAASYNA